MIYYIFSFPIYWNHAKQKHLPLKEDQFNKSWITKGLIKSINFWDKMYRDLKNYSSDSTEYNTLKLNLGTYNFILRRNIYLAKKSHYANLFQKYKSDVKQTWSATSDVVNMKHKSQLSLDRININSTVTNSKNILLIILMIILLTLDQILCTKSIKAPQIIQTLILLIFFETLPHLLFYFN